VDWLVRQNAGTIYCSIETANPDVFQKAKPGDDLARRIAFDRMLERHGARLGNVVMNGLGGPADLLGSILSLRRFRHLSFLYISTFHPVPGTLWARRRPASLRTSLRSLAIARLALPATHLGLAEVEVEDPGSAARTAAQLNAGGGNAFAGLLIYRNRTIDQIDRIRSEALRAGFREPDGGAADPPLRSP
jgi:biotin synthase